MIFSDFAKLIRFYTNTNSTTFTDANILLLANTQKDFMAQQVLQVNENYFGQSYTVDLVANQRQYSFDVTLANQIKFVQVMLDGVNWKRIYESDFNMTNMPVDETDIINAYQQRDTEFAMFDQQIWILSNVAIPTLTGGLQIFGFSWPAAFTDLTLSTEMAVNASATAHGWPRVLQELLARKVSIFYKQNRDKPIALSEHEQAWGPDFNAVLAALSNQNLDRSVLATVPDTDDTGEEV